MLTKNEKKDLKNKETTKKTAEIKKLNKLRSEFKDLQEKYSFINDKHVRLQAEFANYKKRTDKEREELGSYVRADILKNLLPVKDDFKRLLEHLDQDKEKIIEGIDLIAKKVDQYFEQYNIRKIKSTGEEFDPDYHEALMMQPVEKDEDDHKVLQVLEEGYMLGDKVIRHAKVMVGKKE